MGRRRSPWHSWQHGTSQRAAGTGAPCTRNTLRCACPRPARVRENQYSFRWQPAPPSLCRADRSGRGSLSAPRRWSGSLPALSAEAKAGADVSLSQTTRGKTPAPRDPLLPLPLPTKPPTPTFHGGDGTPWLDRELNGNRSWCSSWKPCVLTSHPRSRPDTARLGRSCTGS